MKIYTEQSKVYGELVTSFGTFKLLNSLPNAHSINFLLREQGFIEWYVLDSDGIAKNILLRGEALVKPYYEPVDEEVKLIVETTSPDEV